MMIKVTAEKCVRVTIDDWEVWIDDSTDEKIITQYMLDDEDAEKRK